MAVGDIQEKITESTARLQMCAEQASEWKPKLKSGTEALRRFRATLGAMQRWVDQSEQVLNTNAPPVRERVSIHQVNVFAHKEI